MGLQMAKRKIKRNKGLTIVEFVAAMVLGIPMIVGVIYCAMEANLLFTIRTNLDVATRRAAQELIDEYVQTGTAPADTSNGNLPTALAFDVQTGNGSKYFINRNANQFTWTFDLVNRPNTVTVTTSYPTNGTNGLVRFPSPDPFKLGNGFTIRTSATFPVPPVN
jgi:hypothetical protein